MAKLKKSNGDTKSKTLIVTILKNKAKAISAELFELNLKVQLCNLVTV